MRFAYRDCFRLLQFRELLEVAARRPKFAFGGAKNVHRAEDIILLAGVVDQVFMDEQAKSCYHTVFQSVLLLIERRSTFSHAKPSYDRPPDLLQPPHAST